MKSFLPLLPMVSMGLGEKDAVDRTEA